jgi:hypothetical protein
MLSISNPPIIKIIMTKEQLAIKKIFNPSNLWIKNKLDSKKNNLN